MSLPAHQPQTFLIPVKLRASDFDRTLFPLSSYKKRDSLGRGEYYLDATLDEMIKITHIGANPDEWQVFVNATKTRYDRLMLRKAELQKHPKTWNLLKWAANYRSVRLFLASSKSLYTETKIRSDDIVRVLARTAGRALLSVPGDEVQPVEDDPSTDTEIQGIAIRLDRPYDENVAQQVLDAANIMVSSSGMFEGDETASDASSLLSDEYFSASGSLISLCTIGAENETSTSPSSPPPSSPPPSSPTNVTNNYFIFCAVDSTVIGATAHYGGHDNSGSVNHNVKTTTHNE